MRIKEIIKSKGLTINEVADKLGVSRQALSKQLQGKMLVETADRIARALDVPTWQLFVSPDEITHTDNELSALVVYNNIPHEAHSLTQLKAIVSSIAQDLRKGQ